MPELEDTFEPIAEPVEDTPAETQEEPAQAEPVEAEAEPESAQEPEPEQPKAEADEPKTVPLPTFLAQRDELKELKQKVEALTKQQPKPQAEMPKRPDPFEDPEGAAAWDAQRVHIRDLNRSERMARREYGDDFVEEAFQAAQAAGLAAEFGKSQFGWEDMAEWHKQTVEAQKAKSLASEIGDPAAFKEKLRAEVLAELKAEMATGKVKGLPSLANETSIGGRSAPSVATFTDLDDILK